MAVVRHLGSVVMSQYCVKGYIFMLPILCFVNVEMLINLVICEIRAIS